MSTCRGLWRRPSFGEFVLPHLTDEQTAALMDYDYPGNVRELLNVLERAVVFKTEDFAKPIFYQFALVYRMLKNCPAVYFDREEWKRRVCKRLDALPVTPDADLRLKLAIPTQPEIWV